ncbi:hypothetical protein [Actinoplanes sp. NPDC051411]|uniref:hypothetical protein n=1 Tax=Actinoplanes sp. NPDC051411 TaxID=3155522 RepID=UPI00344648E6
MTGGVFSPGGEATDGTRFTVPPGTAGAIVQTSAGGENSNIDLYVYKDGKLVDRSTASWHSNERSALFFPAPGVYTAYAFAQTASGPAVPYRPGLTLIPAKADFHNATVSEFHTGRDVVPGLLIDSQ